MNTPAKWEVKQKITGTKVINQLVCNGRVVHEVGGNSYDSVKAYADSMNAKGAPEPDPKIITGVDGFSFKEPPKKAKDAPKTFIPSMREWARKHGPT